MKNKQLTYKDAEGIFKLKMNDMITSSVSVYTITDLTDDNPYIMEELFKHSPVTHNSFSTTADNQRIHIKSIMAQYDSESEWDIERVYGLSEVITSLCDLYPDAYVGNIKNQESILANFTSLTRGMSTYLPEGILEQFQEMALDKLEEDGEILDAEEHITIYGTAFSKFTSEVVTDGDVAEHVHAIVLSVFLEFEDVLFVVNFNFNNSLEVIRNEETAIIKTTLTPTAKISKHVGCDYVTALLNAKSFNTKLEEECVTYVTAINKDDYAPYNFVYMMNNLFVAAIEGKSSVYRSLKPMNYFVVSDIVVDILSDVITVDNHVISEFIQENNLNIETDIIDEVEAFGDGLLRLLVTYDKFDTSEDETDFLSKDIAEYAGSILDKYMGLTLTGNNFSTLREYVEEHFYALCKIVGNPNNVKGRMFIEVDNSSLVTMNHVILRDIEAIPLWIYMVAIPCLMYMCNVLDDDSLIELAEYTDSGIENHPKFMETVYMVKELIDRKWN